MTDLHSVNLLLYTQYVRSRAFVRAWRHILYYSWRCVESPFRQMFVLGAMVVVVNPRSKNSRDDSTASSSKLLYFTYQSVRHID